MKYFAEIGIVFSYVVMLILCYFFNWEPFGVFFYYVIEIVVIMFVYTVARFQVDMKFPNFNNKYPNISNVFIGIVPICMLHYFIINWITSEIDPDQPFLKTNHLYTKEVLLSFTSLLILYFVKSFKIKDLKKRQMVFQDNFIYRILALSITNFVGIAAVGTIGKHSLLIVLFFMVLFRALMEIYFNRHIKMV